MFASSAMTTKTPGAAARSKLRLELAAAEKQASAARRAAKLAKLAYRAAKEKFKDARREAKKLRKGVKALKADLAELAMKSPRRKPVAKKPASPPVQIPAVSDPNVVQTESAVPLTEAPPPPQN